MSRHCNKLEFLFIDMGRHFSALRTSSSTDRLLPKRETPTTEAKDHHGALKKDDGSTKKHCTGHSRLPVEACSCTTTSTRTMYGKALLEIHTDHRAGDRHSLSEVIPEYLKHHDPSHRPRKDRKS